MPQHNEQLVKSIAVCAELTGTELSEDAARVMAEDLSRYPLNQVMGALERCRRELKSRLTLAAVIERLDDGRPGVEEAWAMIPHDEGSTVVWTTEMAQAFGVAVKLLETDEVGARMAFKETYTKLISQARNDGIPVKWMPSLGHDKSGRDGPIMEAVAKGRLQATQAAEFLPPPPVPRLEAPRSSAALAHAVIAQLRQTCAK